MDDSLQTFGGFTLDSTRKVLLKEGAPIAISHRAVILLGALIAANGRVVTKTELMDLAWPGQAVEESNLSVQIAALRKILGTRSNGEDWIVTVPRVGYQFLVTDDKAEKAIPTKSIAFEDQPSLAVLPFTNHSASQDYAFFADGMTDDIIAALSRVAELSVVSSSSSQTLKGKGFSAREAARELGVRYLLEGSVRAALNQIRVTAQLTDGETGTAIWAERYDGSPEDVFAFQDDLTRNIVQSLQITLNRGGVGAAVGGADPQSPGLGKGHPGAKSVLSLYDG